MEIFLTFILLIIIYFLLQRVVKIPQPIFLLCLALFSLIIYYPGVPQSDVDFIYQNFLTGKYSDWQPPLYSIWWHLFHFKSADFIMNIVIYYAGLIYISYVLYRKKLHWQNNLLVLFSFYPLYATQLVIILKDVPYTGFLIISVATLLALQIHQQRLVRVLLWIVFFSANFMAIGFKYNGGFAVYPMLVLGVYIMLWNLKDVRLASKPIYLILGSLIAALLIDVAMIFANNVITEDIFNAEKSHSSVLVMYNDLANLECSSGNEIIPDEYFISSDRRSMMCNPFFINYRNYEPLFTPNWSGMNNPGILYYDNKMDDAKFKNLRSIWAKSVVTNLSDYTEYRAKFLINMVFSQWWWTPLSADNPSNMQVKLSELALGERRALGGINGFILIIGNIAVLIYCLFYRRSWLALVVILSSFAQLTSLYLVLGVPAARFFFWNYIAIFIALAMTGIDSRTIQEKLSTNKMGVVEQKKNRKRK